MHGVIGFIDWCFVQAVGVDRTRELLIGFSAGCTQDWNWLKAKGLIVSEPQAGDLIFFRDLSHIGIIEKVEGNTIYTIEGNTSNAAELITNGGCVARKSYSKGSSVIYGFARPKYDGPAEVIPDEPEKESYPLIRKGDSGYYVRLAQEKLMAKGYRLPKFGADSFFGNETEETVKELQRDAGLEVDRIIGDMTWGVLNSDFVKPNGPAYPGYLIKRGQQSEDVRKVQARLIELGYNCGKYGADSIFGGDTEKAVRKFQSNNGLGVDGIVGPATWGKLF